MRVVRRGERRVKNGSGWGDLVLQGYTSVEVVTVEEEDTLLG